MKKFIYWSPRILSILFVIFLSLFALDVFGEFSGWDLVVALFMHLIPSFVLLLVILIAWRRDLVGAFVFIAGGFFYIWVAGLNRPISWYLAISGPAFLVGILFAINWILNRKKDKLK